LPIPDELCHAFMNAHLIPTRTSWAGDELILNNASTLGPPALHQQQQSAEFGRGGRDSNQSYQISGFQVPKNQYN